jgi:DNA mismatch repair ATPase MutS
MLGNQILEVTSAIYAAERDAFDAIRNDVSSQRNTSCLPFITIQVIASALQLRRNARVLDELDVTISFANLAQEMNFVRPILVEQ